MRIPLCTSAKIGSSQSIRLISYPMPWQYLLQNEKCLYCAEMFSFPLKESVGHHRSAYFYSVNQQRPYAFLQRRKSETKL